MIHFKWKRKQKQSKQVQYCKRCVRERTEKMIRNLFAERVMWISVLATLNTLNFILFTKLPETKPKNVCQA